MISRNMGFTLVELLVVVAVLLVVLGLSTAYFDNLYSRLYENDALAKSATTVRTTLEEARSLTISAKGGLVYGVHLETSKVVLFQGTTYDASASTNIVRQLGLMAQISGFSLQGGGSDVTFERLVGDTTKYGTITLSLTRDSSITRTVTISTTGFVTTQ